MKSRSSELADRSIAAMLSAIELYNKPRYLYRIESFCVLAINAWELLLKAKWLSENNNKISSLYQREKKSKSTGEKFKRSMFVRTKGSKSPKTHSLSFIVKNFVEQKKLDKAVADNIDILDEFRNFSVHYYFDSEAIALKLQEISLASVRNFSTLLSLWFKRDLSEFETVLLPLALGNPTTKYQQDNTSEENRFLKFLCSKAKVCESSDSRFSVAINVNVSFSRSSEMAGVLPVCISNNPNDPKVCVSDTQLLEGFPYDYKMLVSRMNERYSDFVQNKDFYRYKRRIEQNQSLFILRKLDPRSKKNVGMKFYSVKVFDEFDKYYRRKK